MGYYLFQHLLKKTQPNNDNKKTTLKTQEHRTK